MSVRRAIVSTLVTVVGGSALAVLPAPVHAEVDPAVIEAALDLPAGVTATSSGSASTQTQEFNDFPSAGSDYALLSTGDADAVYGTDRSVQLSTDHGNDEVPDVSTITLTVAQGTPSAGCLFVDFAMGTEERVHLYTEQTPGDAISIKKASDPAKEYALNAGKKYFNQPNEPYEPKPYTVNAVKYWHQPGDWKDPLHGTDTTPRLDNITGLNYVTTRDTARIPISTSGGDEVVTISVSDAGNSDLDSVAFVDKVRMRPSCSGGTGVEPLTPGIIVGDREVGSVLAYDPDPGTEKLEKYDEPDNKWISPSSGVQVELRFRWYRTTSGYAGNGDMRRWEAIENADRQRYVLTADDLNMYLIVLVSGVVDGRVIETFPSTNDSPSWYVTTAIEQGQFDPPSPLPTLVNADPAVVGERISVSVGHTTPRQDTWEYQWYARTPGSSSASAIAGQTGQEIQLSTAQAGKQVFVRAEAVRPGIVRQRWDSPLSAVVQLKSLDWPGEPAVPTIDLDDDPVPGTQLSANPGTGWPAEVTSWSYVWSADGTTVASTQNYTLQPADAGKSVTVTVRGAPDGYQPLLATSAPVVVEALPISESPVPTIAGEPRVDLEVTAETGTWGPSPVPLQYQWQRNGIPIDGARFPTYTLQPADAGTALTVSVTSNKIGYERITRTSQPVTAVGRLMVGATPTITGIAKVGQRLTGSAAGWSPTTPSLTYSWYSGTRLLQSSTSRYYTITAAAEGAPIVLRVRATKYGYAPLERDSAPTAKVAKGTITPGTVRIYGSASVGSTLRLSPGTWKPTGVTLKYQWKIGTRLLSGTTRTSLKLPSSARGKRVTVYVTGTKSGYTTVKRSAVTGVVR